MNDGFSKKFMKNSKRRKDRNGEKKVRFLVRKRILSRG